jgi:hypothetical protein
MQHNSFVATKGFLDAPHQFNAIFNPFPEGTDHVEPNKCISYWLTIPNVQNTKFQGICVVAFIYACKHVSNPGFGGRLTESILTSHELTASFCAYCQRIPNFRNISFGQFLEHFHQEYLVEASVTYHNFQLNEELTQQAGKSEQHQVTDFCVCHLIRIT